MLQTQLVVSEVKCGQNRILNWKMLRLVERVASQRVGEGKKKGKEWKKLEDWEWFVEAVKELEMCLEESERGGSQRGSEGNGSRVLVGKEA